jgi:hypothetical protein
MVERLLEQKEALKQYAFDEDNLKLTLTREEWQILEDLVGSNF